MTPRRAGRGMFLQRAEHRISTLPQLRADTHEVRFEAATSDELVDDRLRQKRWRDVRSRRPAPRTPPPVVSGSTKYPLRTPGATVFENDDVYVTSSPALELAKARLGAHPRSGRARTGRPREPRGSCSRTTSTRRARRSADSVLPLGFWKVGIVYRNDGRSLRLRSSTSSASGSRPSSSISSATISAPSRREDLERAVVRRRLHEHAARSPRELLGGVEDESLESADREDDPLRPDAVPPRDPLTKRPVATARPVREAPSRRRAAPPRMRTPRAPRPGPARAQGLRERRKWAAPTPRRAYVK